MQTINKKGYTKHYFEEGKRICSKIGSGELKNVFDPVPKIEKSYEEQRDIQVEGIHTTYSQCMSISPFIKNGNLCKNIINKYTTQVSSSEPAFYYHSDHLGSASYITGSSGIQTQQLVYLPFGEDWVDKKYNVSQFQTPYKFNGKEKDQETGYNYFGARYYYDWASIWLSVDPLSDKYPHLTSYNYCANNPVMLVDPDGRKITPQSKKVWNSQKMAVSLLFSSALKNYNTNGSNKRELDASGAMLLLMAYVEKSSQTYNFINSDLTRSVYNKETGAIDIYVNNDGGFFHEFMHMLQFENNDLGYNKDGGGEALDINDDKNAFMWQAIFVPESIPDELKDSKGNINITNDNIRSIKKNVGEQTTYPYNKEDVPNENLNGDSCNGEKRYCDPNGGLIFKDMHE